jgi:hypothetical protein
MPELSLDFKWYRDLKGYRFIEAKPVPLRRGQSILDVPFRGDWSEFARIVRKGGKLQSYRPLDVSSKLFKIFIDKAKTESGVYDFVTKYGPLTYEGLKGGGEIVRELMDRAEDMSQAIGGRILAMPLKPLNVSIHTERGRLRLKITPACLLDALWLQLAQAKDERAGPRQCEHCDKTFLGRRADAKFCSDACRIAFNSLERTRRKRSR